MRVLMTSSNGIRAKFKDIRTKFKWSLARDGMFSGTEAMDERSLFDTIPKLIRSEEAWTQTAWVSGSIVAYVRIDHDGLSSLEPDSPIHDSFIPMSSDGLKLPVELMETICLLALQNDAVAQKLSMVCMRSREIIMRHRRHEAFHVLTERFVRNGLGMWIDCGHFHPVAIPNSPSTLFYGHESTYI
ncbi:hypothetical protein H0H87_006352 [Tephrocybe sp. NHM501043]|nr:hypothetical protein H0H87_006352 [Tephrocybe sp. NHM501043]